MSLKFSSGGSSITNRFARSAAAGEELGHPWKIYLSDDNTKFGVEYKSDVYDGFNYDKITVTGLVKVLDDQNDPGWTTITEGYIFLWGTVVNGVVESITVKNDQNSLDNIYRLKFDSENKQTNFAHVLAYIYNNGTAQSPDWKIRQTAWRDISLIYVVVNGVVGKATCEV